MLYASLKVCPQCGTQYSPLEGHRCAPVPGTGAFDIAVGRQPGSIAERIEQLRDAITQMFTHTRERSLALTNLEQAELWLLKAKPEDT